MPYVELPLQTTRVTSASLVGCPPPGPHGSQSLADRCPRPQARFRAALPRARSSPGPAPPGSAVSPRALDSPALRPGAFARAVPADACGAHALGSSDRRGAPQSLLRTPARPASPRSSPCTPRPPEPVSSSLTELTVFERTMRCSRLSCLSSMSLLHWPSTTKSESHLSLVTGLSQRPRPGLIRGGHSLRVCRMNR